MSSHPHLGISRRSVRIGCGAGFAGDRIEPALDLVRRGELDYLVFECLAERTLALAQLRIRSGGAGYDPLLRMRLQAVLPDAVARGVRIITNAGAADPVSAGRMIAALAEEQGLQITVGIIEGDDVIDVIGDAARTAEEDRPLEEYGALLSANAYLGSAPIVEALELGADVVVTGRVADAALFVAPALFHHSAGLDDAAFLANATVMGHLLECGAQVTGGYFADGGVQQVPGLERVGLPIADVQADGSFTLSVTPGAGGAVTRHIVIEQLLYEITDPHAYITPDAVIDVTEVEVVERGDGTVHVRTRLPAGDAPLTLKASVGYDAGFVVEGEISYMGARHGIRGGMARGVLERRLSDVETLTLERLSGTLEDARGGRYGCTRLRVAGRAAHRSDAERIAQEIGALYTTGPAGGAGIRTSIEPLIGIVSVLLDRSLIRPRVSLLGEGTR